MPSSWLLESLSGVCGAACLVAAGAPFDSVKLHAQLHGGGILSAASAVVRAGGLRALWSGAAPAFASAALENAVFFAASGALRRGVAASAHGGDEAALGVAGAALVGAASGVLSSVVICPAEVLKVRMQQAGSSGAPAAGLLAAARALARPGGGAFAGLRALLARDVPFYFVFLGTHRAATLAVASAAGLPRSAAADGGAPAWLSRVAGGVAGAAAWAVVFPLDTLKSRAQAAGGGGGGGLLRQARALGARALYAGAPAAIARGAVANAALFAGQNVAHGLLGAVLSGRE